MVERIVQPALYKTEDGKLFATKAEASRHEAECELRQWLHQQAWPYPIDVFDSIKADLPKLIGILNRMRWENRTKQEE